MEIFLDKRVEAAMWRFRSAKKNPRFKKIKGGLSTFLRLCQDPENSFDSIGKELQVSGETARKLYCAYLQETLGAPESRRSLRFQHRREAQEMARREEFLNGPRGDILRRAEAKGLVCSVPNKHLLVCDGIPCSPHALRSGHEIRAASGRLYATVHYSTATLIQCQFVLVLVNVEGFPEHCLVLPSAVLQRVGEYFNIPIQRGQPWSPRARGPKSAISWDDYEDAWWQIRPE